MCILRDFQTGVQASPVCLTIYMKGLNGQRTDHTLRVIVPTIRFPIWVVCFDCTCQSGCCEGDGMSIRAAQYWQWHSISWCLVWSVTLIPMILMVPHTSRSVDCSRRYRTSEVARFLFTQFYSPSKNSISPHFSDLQDTSHIAT